MKTCSRCQKVFPASSFYREGSWCDGCRREVRNRYKQEWPEQTLARKPSVSNHPMSYSALHCGHIARYTKRAIERFEHKTGQEAPPELLAIHQLAARLTDDQATQLVQRTTTETECRNCGRPVNPSHGRKYCTLACKDAFLLLVSPKAQAKLRRKREAERIRKGRKPPVSAEAREQAKAATERYKEARRAKHEQQARMRDAKAMRALAFREQGMGWQEIADTLGYPGPGSAYSALRYRGIDPRSIRRPVAQSPVPR